MRARKEPYEVIRDRLERGRTVVLDGGVGSELVRRGVRWRDHGLRTDTAAVHELHREYLEAGAHVIRTNTFQLNRRIYQNVFRDAAHLHHIGAPDLDQRIPKLIPRAVDLARAARQQAGRDDVAIAGVMSPLEHCFRPDLLSDASRMARDEGAEAVLVNCAPPEDIERAVAAIHDGDVKIGACAHIGRFDPPSWKFEFFPQFRDTDAWPPPRYSAAAARWQDSGARILGGCCGTGPAHVRALAELAG